MGTRQGCVFIPIPRLDDHTRAEVVERVHVPGRDRRSSSQEPGREDGSGSRSLVGHSWGGYVITSAAHALIGRLAKVVHYNAVVPARGAAMVDENAELIPASRAAAYQGNPGRRITGGAM